MSQDQQNVFVIRTLECDVCQRFDSLLLTELELKERVERNSLQIGSRLINHGDHLRIIYFDINGNYLGDTMSLNIRYKLTETYELDVPLLLKNSSKKSPHRKILRFLRTKNLEISIIGPSMAGKTSLTRYLETGVPERMTHRINHPPTMGQSTKRFDLSGNKITIYDMGGQKDFWHLWDKHFHKVEFIIYVLDGAANNLEIALEGLELLFNTIGNQKLLIVLNKYDLRLDGYSNHFIDPTEILNGIDIPKDLQYWVINTSVYNGLAYNYSGVNNETTLSEAIIDFFDR